MRPDDEEGQVIDDAEVQLQVQLARKIAEENKEALRLLALWETIAPELLTQVK